MNESQAVGLRLGNSFLRKIESLGEEEQLDRSTAMRILLEEGYESHVKRKAAEEYIAGRITISKAAKKAGISLWEMENYLVNKGFKSQYSVEDLKEELSLEK